MGISIELEKNRKFLEEVKEEGEFLFVSSLPREPCLLLLEAVESENRALDDCFY